MGGRGGSMGGSHGMGGGGGAGGAAKAAAPAASQTCEQQLLAQIKGNPAALMQMSDQDAADTVKAIDNLPIAKDGTQNDTFVQRYVSLIGWDANKPTVLSEAAYEKARKASGEKSMYHAVNDAGGVSGSIFNNQLMYGDSAYAFNGVYGAGTYWAYARAGASGAYGRHQVKAFLNSNAKAVDKSTLEQQLWVLQKTKPRLYAALENAKAGYGNKRESIFPVLAASHGYNTILAHDGKHTGAYIVTLDRSALTMSSKTVSNASSRMRSW